MREKEKELSEQAQNQPRIETLGRLVPVLGDPEAEKRRISRERIAAGVGVNYPMLWRRSQQRSWNKG